MGKAMKINAAFNAPTTRKTTAKSWHMSDTARLRLMRMDLHHLMWAVSFLNDALDDEFTSTADLVLVLANIDELKPELEMVRDKIRALKAGL